jgi:hypothetical protein
VRDIDRGDLNPEETLRMSLVAVTLSMALKLKERTSSEAGSFAYWSLKGESAREILIRDVNLSLESRRT